MTISPCSLAVNATAASYGYPTSADGEGVVLTSLGGGNFAVDWLPPTFGPGEKAQVIMANRAPDMGQSGATAFGVHKWGFSIYGADRLIYDGDAPVTFKSTVELVGFCGHKDDLLAPDPTQPGRGVFNWVGLGHSYLRIVSADVYPNGAGPGLIGLPQGEQRRVNSVGFVSNFEMLIPSRGTVFATLQLNHQVTRAGLNIIAVLTWTDPDARCQTIYGIMTPTTTTDSLLVGSGSSIALPFAGESGDLGPANLFDFHWNDLPGISARLSLPTGGSGPLGWGEADTCKSAIKERKLYVRRFSKDVPGVPASGVSNSVYQVQRFAG